ncbi:MAG: DUF368 domain-containing protein [Nocardioides sp.]
MTETAPRRLLRLPLDLLRGFLIGMAELVPGVSGGTVALVTGVYEQLIGSASHALTAIKRLVLGPDRWAGFRTEARRTDWLLVVPVLIGMGAAVLTVAGAMEAFVTDHPEDARGLFLGLVLASIAVPLRMAARTPGGASIRLSDVAFFGVAAVAAFVLVGYASGREIADPPAWAVFLAAAVAVCALVVPGVSGSFFLLAVGLYSTTLEAIDTRDLRYLSIFAAGAIVGLASFVQLLHYLLGHHRRATLVTMAGLMLGSLRALWPWQASSSEVAGDAHGPGALVAPYDPVLGPVLLAVLGVLVVVVLILVEDRAARRASEPAPAP